MENYIYHPFLSMTFSIILAAGTYSLGKYFLVYSKFDKILSRASYIEFQYLSFGILFSLVFLFPLISFLNISKDILKIFAILLCFLSIKFFKEIPLIIKKIKFRSSDILHKIFILLLSLYFLLSLTPLTSADVLDYHIGSALNILRFDKYVLYPEWFTSLQSGSGETLIALGLSIGSEQYGSIVQFSSILTISGILLRFYKKNLGFKSKYFLPVTILCCPILIFLLSGNKPQIYFSSILFLALSINFIRFNNEREKLFGYLIINIIIFSCIAGKFSFNLSGFLVWAISTLFIINKKNFFKIFFIVLIPFLIIYVPFIFWKYINLGGNIFTYLYSPFPLHFPGYETFLSHNRGSQEIPFPYFLFYTTPSRITEFLGFNILFIILIFFIKKKNVEINFTILIISLFLIISNLYASPSARYYLDPILWSTFLFLFSEYKKINQYLPKIFIPQIIVVILILLYSIINFLPGSFTVKNYKNIKKEFAYMYSGFDWINDNIPENSNVLILNRAISQYKESSISGWFNYFTSEEESKFYKKLILKKKPTYLVYFGSNPDLRYMKNCVDGLYMKKDKVGFHATRNPFNRGSYYNAYIYNINYENLNTC
ncbi:DUF1420 domain-containing protein [Candidatus Pelagibacter sp.]|nr:DUF1420 domain-containing protein [Candidatus Pelagibacter sp.]